jgi:hypothetical protein
MGRASNRKKTQRQASGRPQLDAATQLANHRLVGRLKALVDETNKHQDRVAAARWIWSGGAELIRAEAPQWPEGSLGDRFFGSTFLREARKAPSLLTAEIPDPKVIAAHSAHWNVATFALVRAVVYDGLAPDQLAVSSMLDVLAPMAETDLAWKPGPARNLDEVEFPDQDGPVFLLGTCVLSTAVRAVVGEDALTDIQAVLIPVLIKLARSGTISPRDMLPVGLTLLSALASLCRSDSPSLLDRAA